MSVSQALLQRELLRLKKLRQEREAQVQPYTLTGIKYKHGDELPEKYDPKKPCRKCNSDDHTLRHRSEIINKEANYILPERLHIVCNRCKFAWETLPLDM